MVFQNYALFPHMTVAQNVAYPLTVRKVPKDEQVKRVQKALDMVRLSGMGDRSPTRLSGGQQQRVALARALVFEPQLVLMDEPLGALDKQLREHMQLELKELHRQLGVTFVYVTHDQGEALTMSDRVAVFNEGVIQQLANSQNLYETPNNRFVAGFVGDSTILAGTLGGTAAAPYIELNGSGQRLEGVNVNQVTNGAKVEACVRPERIALHLQPLQSSNTVPVQVAGIVYYGDHVRLQCDFGAVQAQATVKLPLTHPCALTPPAMGSTVHLEFPPAFTRVYAL
jgi:putative spermidine/putrescine transport system ATP-binding protein